jgi:hypothetical protein
LSFEILDEPSPAQGHGLIGTGVPEDHLRAGIGENPLATSAMIILGDS